MKLLSRCLTVEETSPGCPVRKMEGVARRLSPTLDASTRTASADVTSLVVNPGMLPSLFGHADIFLANTAAKEVWKPILDWILAHR